MKKAEFQDKNTENDSKENVKKVFKLVRNVSSGIGLCLFAFLLVITVWIAIDKFVLKSSVPSFAGYSLLKIGSGSMENTIMEGDLILIKRTDEFITGDIITFIHEGEEIPTTHRIINFSSTRDEFQTRGDANNTPDTVFVTKDEVIGKMIYHFKGSALVMGWLTKGGGFIFVISIAFTLLVGIYILRIEKSNDSENRGDNEAGPEEKAEAEASAFEDKSEENT